MKTSVRNVPTPSRAGSNKEEEEQEKERAKDSERRPIDEGVQQETDRPKGTDTRPAAISSPPPLPEHLSHVRPLGKGAYGDVWLCKDLNNNEHVAVKWVRDFSRDSLFGKRILREIRILAALKHRNLLKLTDLLPPPSADFDDVFIVMPYMEFDMSKVIYSGMALSEAHVQAFVCQILGGLRWLHSAGVVHRDLKPANILVNKDCSLRIADFGLARGRANEEEVLTEYVVTRWYRAPELMLMPSGYFEAVDLWSVGCIHAELLTRKPLFPGDNAIDMLRRFARTLGFSQERDLCWLQAQGSELEGILSLVEEMKCAMDQPLETLLPSASEVCLEFILRLLTFDPTKRLSAADAIAHPYLRPCQGYMQDSPMEETAQTPFSWDFDRFEPTQSALKDRVYLECARLHPEILSRDSEQLKSSGRCHLLDSCTSHAGKKPLGPPPNRVPGARRASQDM